MFDINDFIPIKDKVLIEIKKDNHLTILSKKIKTSSGGIIEFDFDFYTDPTDNTLKESRELGDVIAIGDECSFCQVGDMAILDYTVDEDKECIVHETNLTKFIVIPEKGKFAEKNHGIYNQNGSYCKIYNKGDSLFETNIFGVIRNENIICNNRYVIFTEEDADANFEISPNGLYLPKSADVGGDVKELTIEFAPINSKYKSGDKVLVYQYFLFTKPIQCNAFLMAYEQDILCKKKEAT